MCPFGWYTRIKIRRRSMFCTRVTCRCGRKRSNSAMITMGSERAQSQTVALLSSLHPHQPKRRTKLIGCGETPSHAAACGVEERLGFQTSRRIDTRLLPEPARSQIHCFPNASPSRNPLESIFTQPFTSPICLKCISTCVEEAMAWA